MLDVDIPKYQTIVVQTLSEIDLLLKNYVFQGYTGMSHYMRLPLGVISALYITILGYSIMMGWVKVSMGNFVKTALKIGFIYMAVTDWAWVSEYFVGFINGAVGELGDALVAASPIPIPGADGIDGAMQMTLIQFTQLGNKIFSTGGLSNFGPYLDGIILWGFGYLLVGLGLFEIILSKVMLAILFIFAPLIVVFCYFKPLQGIFDRWIGAIVGFALLQLFVTAALGLGLSLEYWWVAAHVATDAVKIGNMGTLPIVIVGIIAIGIVSKAAQLAQSLGGNVTSASGSAMVAGMVGGAVGASMSGLGVAASSLKIARAAFGGHGAGSGKGASESSKGKSSMKDAQKNLKHSD